ncbi:Hypothetical predicted protein [Octopus vulgaris]|uniref:Uncharacterized protein n=1 Tax=Octopus vulgaris TaxID=6645 RepID=A0AA36B0Y7_OCTVU|nr:Hypothetical predicted protein [Octopus vulgaris]
MDGEKDEQLGTRKAQLRDDTSAKHHNWQVNTENVDSHKYAVTNGKKVTIANLDNIGDSALSPCQKAFKVFKENLSLGCSRSSVD